MCEWFIEPKDANTNRIIAERLAEMAPEEEDHEVLCADLTRHNLWRAPNHSFIAELKRNAGQLWLNFKVYRRVGNGLPKHFVLF